MVVSPLFSKVMLCIGEGDGTPLQYSCLENPMDGGAWWAAVYGVPRSRTRLKRLSSSNAVQKSHYVNRVLMQHLQRSL